MADNIVVRTALDLKNALAAIPDEKLAALKLVIDETDVEEDTIELEFWEDGGVLTILGNHI